MKLSRTSVDDGLLIYPGVIEKVGYDFRSDEKMRVGKGEVTGPPDLLRDAFRQGRLTLKLAEGSDIRIIVVAHTVGGERAFFEIES